MSALPPDITVEAQGIGESRRVVLTIDETTFELHPDDARAIGEALVAKAGEAAREDGE